MGYGIHRVPAPPRRRYSGVGSTYRSSGHAPTVHSILHDAGHRQTLQDLLNHYPGHPPWIGVIRFRNDRSPGVRPGSVSRLGQKHILRDFRRLPYHGHIFHVVT